MCNSFSFFLLSNLLRHEQHGFIFRPLKWGTNYHFFIKVYFHLLFSICILLSIHFPLVIFDFEKITARYQDNSVKETSIKHFYLKTKTKRIPICKCFMMNDYFFCLMLHHDNLYKQYNISDCHPSYGWTAIVKFLSFWKLKMID